MTDGERFNTLRENYAGAILAIIETCRADYAKVAPRTDPCVDLATLTARIVAAFPARQKHECQIPGFRANTYLAKHRIRHVEIRDVELDGKLVMTSKPRVIFVCVAFALSAIVSWAGCGSSTSDATSAPGPGGESFLKLKPGMSPAEVVQLLGEPTHKGAAASATMRGVQQRLAEFESTLPPAFEAAASAPAEAPADADDPLEGEWWLYGPYHNLHLGDTVTAVGFTNSKLDSALRQKVIQPPAR
jgi:hypothetical protein